MYTSLKLPEMGAVFTLIQLAVMIIPSSLSSLEPLRVTEEHRIALANLKQLVRNDLTQEYMMDDFYLTRWLHKQNFNVGDTLHLLQEYLKWRSEEKMDSILEENWTDMRLLFPYSRNTTDKNGGPILYIDWNDWDVATFLEGGQSAYDRMLRYMFMYKEETAAHIRRLREEESNVTKFTFIINAGGFSSQKHLCALCSQLPKDLNFINAKFLPAVESGSEVIINVPKSFSPIYAQLPAAAKVKIMFFGQDREQWESKLREIIDIDQFPSNIFNETWHKDNADGFLSN